MEDGIKWIRCSHTVYRAIYDEYKDNLGVYAVAGLYGSDHMTTWGMDGSPIIKSCGEKDPETGRTSADPKTWRYYFAIAKYPEGIEE